MLQRVRYRRAIGSCVQAPGREEPGKPHRGIARRWCGWRAESKLVIFLFLIKKYWGED